MIALEHRTGWRHGGWYEKQKLGFLPEQRRLDSGVHVKLSPSRERAGLSPNSTCVDAVAKGCSAE
jgi:hypothetical protein